MTFLVAGAVEAPAEVGVENEDSDNSCGDPCFVNKVPWNISG